MPVTFYIHNTASVQNILHGENPDAVMKRTILTRLHAAFPPSENVYAVVFHDDDARHRETPLPDLLILSEHGIGMLDLFHESGSIFRSEDVWYADGKQVQGNIHTGARNPHEHIQMCAEHVRQYLMIPPEDGAPWLSGRYITWQDLIFDTAVCFTSPDADFPHIQSGETIKDWERFSALGLKDLPQWMTHLAFEENIEDRGGVQSYRLPQRNITRIVTELFPSTEIEHIPEPQATPPRPYGYLLLRQHDDIIARFILNHEKMTVGREPSCDVMLPKQYRMVSRVHANLICTENGVTISDMSRNGIFIEGTRIHTPVQLLPGQRILLGGSRLMDGVCQLEYSTKPALSQAS